MNERIDDHLHFNQQLLVVVVARTRRILNKTTPFLYNIVSLWGELMCDC